MDKWGMYLDIHQMKKQKFSVTAIARKLGVSRGTVYSYLEKSPQEMSEWEASTHIRTKKLDVHKELILNWVRAHRDVSAAQIYDWLMERYPDFSVGESTVRSYVREIRIDYHLPKEKVPRQYEAIPDPPLGQQAQVDFGTTKQLDEKGKRMTMYFVSFVLSNSRYKYMEWLCRPFTTKDLIQAHENAFKFYGGIPYEIVYDQDNIIVVSENNGDIIYTAEFAAYQKDRKFEIHLCRKADPESKGKIENVVGYIKKNFAKHRVFTNIDSWNEQALAWLKRTGNGKIHNTTKKRPADVFTEEQQHLRPIFRLDSATNTEPTKHINKSSISRTVRKDNTVLYKSNRYTVPLGTYSPMGTEVDVNVDNNQLSVFLKDSGEVIATHEVDQRRGELVQDKNHRRDRSKGIDAYLETTANLFPDKDKAMEFLHYVRQERSRYIRDQLQSIIQHCEDTEEDILDQALSTCLSEQLFSASAFADIVKHYKRYRSLNTKQNHNIKSPSPKPLKEEHRIILNAKPTKSDVRQYVSILEGN